MNEQDRETVRALLTVDSGALTINPIPWPQGFQPEPSEPTVAAGQPLPKCDVLIVTWTVDEAHALSTVLTPGVDSAERWIPYTHNYGSFAKLMRSDCPARTLRRLGLFWQTTINGRNVVVLKSDSHMSQDGAKLPELELWQQWIRESRPRLVVTTGTAGGIGASTVVGDVLVSNRATFKCQHDFKDLNGESFVGLETYPQIVDPEPLFAANASKLPPDEPGLPTLTYALAPSQGVLTTDFFAFDDQENTYGLQASGLMVEMGDALLGKALAGMPGFPTGWLSVRNASDPQIPASVGDLAAQAKQAESIYVKYGRWSSVCSAIVSGLIAGNA